MLKKIALFLSVCCFCHAEVEYEIIPLSLAGQTFDLSMIRPRLGPNVKDQTISRVKVEDWRIRYNYYLNDPVSGQNFIMSQVTLTSPTFLSDSGYVLWYTPSASGGSDTGYVWSLDSDLRTINPMFSTCRPMSINNRGDVIYLDHKEGRNTVTLTILAPLGNKSISIGPLDSKTDVQGSSINDYRQIVGQFEGGRAFIWDENNGIRDLNLLIRENSGWSQLSYASHISNEGLIVGRGTYQGQSLDFLLIPINSGE